LKDRKAQNSALLIATLGVYLGLVLAGAAPQVLANAALSKQFNVRDEIEFKDDLDKKPDDPRSPVTVSVKNYLEDVESFLISLGRLSSSGTFDLKKDTFDVVQSTLLPCADSNLAGRYSPVRFEATNDSLRPSLEYFSRGMVYGYSLGDCVPTNEFKEITAADSRFNFKLDASDLVVNIGVKKETPQRALELERELASVLALYSAQDAPPLRKKIIDSTRFHVENNKLFINLRLPRGSLPSLLADAK
jgi:hypothetical protein